MKKFLQLSTLFFFLFSCSKDNDKSNPKSIADQFVGSWKVDESVSKNIGGIVGNYTFNSVTVKRNDSTFGVVQSNRNPVPEWVGKGPFSADTLWFEPILDGRRLNNNAQGNIGTFSEKKDTLTFTYLYGSSSYFVYVVNQKWVRK